MNHTWLRSTALWIAAGVVVLGGLLAYVVTQWAEPNRTGRATTQAVLQQAVDLQRTRPAPSGAAAVNALARAVPAGLTAVVDPVDSTLFPDGTRHATDDHGTLVVANGVQARLKHLDALNQPMWTTEFGNGTWVAMTAELPSRVPVAALLITVATALATALAVLVHRTRRVPATAPNGPAAEQPLPIPAGPDPQVLELQAQRQRMVLGLTELVATLPPEFEWQAENVLRAAGVRAVDADGEVFDPHMHHAVDTEPTSDAALGDTVARTLRRGWVDGNHVVVPARVVVYVAPDRPAVLP
jgi:hypothetical protein